MTRSPNERIYSISWVSRGVSMRHMSAMHWAWDFSTAGTRKCVCRWDLEMVQMSRWCLVVLHGGKMESLSVIIHHWIQGRNRQDLEEEQAGCRKPAPSVGWEPILWCFCHSAQCCVICTELPKTVVFMPCRLGKWVQRDRAGFRIVGSGHCTKLKNLKPAGILLIVVLIFLF